jgi:hypothetical protein
LYLILPSPPSLPPSFLHLSSLFKLHFQSNSTQS